MTALDAIVVEFDSPNASRGRVLVNGRELKGVRAISLSATVGELVKLTLDVLPETLRMKMPGVDVEVNEQVIAEVTAMGDDARRYAKVDSADR